MGDLPKLPRNVRIWFACALILAGGLLLTIAVYAVVTAT